MLRTAVVLLLLLLAAMGCCGFYANAWAAWAPPGAANPDYPSLVFASRFYGTLGALCLALALFASFYRPRGK